MKNKYKAKGIFWRLLAFPFVFCITLLSGVINSIYSTFFFVKFGGEWITYKSENEKATINDIFEELLKQRNENL